MDSQSLLGIMTIRICLDSLPRSFDSVNLHGDGLTLLCYPIVKTSLRWYPNINGFFQSPTHFLPRLRSRLTLSGLTLLKETLDFRRADFSSALSLLMPASSLPNCPALLSVCLQPNRNAPLPLPIKQVLNFKPIF